MDADLSLLSALVVESVKSIVIRLGQLLTSQNINHMLNIGIYSSRKRSKMFKEYIQEQKRILEKYAKDKKVLRLSRLNYWLIHFVLIAHLFDIFMTFYGISLFGLHWELNPIIVFMTTVFGFWFVMLWKMCVITSLAYFYHKMLVLNSMKTWVYCCMIFFGLLGGLSWII